MQIASDLQAIDLNEELIDARTENCSNIETDEDMIVCICYIAECFTFGREPDFKNLDLETFRKHIVELFIRFISLS